jgi:hypothetical protein
VVLGVDLRCSVYPPLPMTLAGAFLNTVSGSLTPVDEITSTWSAHGLNREWRWYMVLAVNISATYRLFPQDLGPHLAASSFVALDFFGLSSGSAEPLPVSASNPLVVEPGNAQPSPFPGAQPLRYYLLAPMIGSSGWVLVGEANKFVPMSGLRMREFSATATGFSVVITFDQNGLETSLTMLVIPPAAGVAAVKCMRPSSTAVSMTLACAGATIKNCSCM